MKCPHRTAVVQHLRIVRRRWWWLTPWRPRRKLICLDCHPEKAR